MTHSSDVISFIEQDPKLLDIVYKVAKKALVIGFVDVGIELSYDPDATAWHQYVVVHVISTEDVDTTFNKFNMLSDWLYEQDNENLIVVIPGFL